MAKLTIAFNLYFYTYTFWATVIALNIEGERFFLLFKINSFAEFIFERLKTILNETSYIFVEFFSVKFRSLK